MTNITEQKEKFIKWIEDAYDAKPINKGNACMILDISESSLNRAIANKSIRHHKMPGRNGRVTFTAEDLSDYFYKHVVLTVDDLEMGA